MNFRTTLILFVLVVAGLIFFIVANRSGCPSEDTGSDTASAGPSEGRKLLDVKSEDVRKLVIRPAEGQPLELVKAENDAKSVPAPDASEWRMVQPTAWAADNFDARALVDSVVNLKSLSLIHISEPT